MTSRVFFSFLLFSNLTLFGQFTDYDTIANNYGFPVQTFEVDVNMDGDTDLVVLYNTDLVWFENKQNGMFAGAKKLCPTINVPGKMLPVDMDNDSDIDFLATNVALNDLTWIENDGSGIFTAVHLVDGSMGNLKAMEFGDIDGDGDGDIITSLTTGVIYKYINLGSGVFGPKQSINTGAPADDLELADLDGDLDYDLVFTVINDDQVAWLQNIGGGAFGAEQIITSINNGVYLIMTFDIEGDGDIDIVTAPDYVTGGSYQYIMLYTNSGSGTFTSSTISNGAYSMQFDVLKKVDYNNDGFMDVFTVETGSDIVSAFINNGNGTFQTGLTHFNAATNVSHFVNVADFNNDGLQDLVYMEGEDFYLDYNLGGGNFEFQNAFNNSVNGAIHIHQADLDNDGDLDVIVSNSAGDQLCWFENLGGDEFSGRKTLDIWNNSMCALTDDVDSDGDLDIIAGFVEKVKWYENLGGGNFGPPIELLSESTSGFYRLQYVDLDQDGDKDIISAMANWGAVMYWENLGGMTFGSAEVVTLNVPTFPTISLDDLDNDGDLDVAVSSSGDGVIGWVENLGGLNFGTLTVLTSSAAGAKNVDTEDLDGDGDYDILFCSSGTEKIGWFENLGSGNFSGENIISTAYGPVQEAKAADIDNDGDIDIYVAGGFSELLWFENMGAGNFSSTAFSNPVNGIAKVYAGDMDLDGDVDITMIAAGTKVLVSQSNFFSDTQVSGTMFVDLNSNEVMDGGDYGFPNFGIFSSPQSDFTFTSNSGFYLMNFSDSTGTYVLAPNVPNHWVITTDSLSFTINIDSVFTVMDSLDFGFAPDTLIDSLSVNLVGGFPRCNDEVNYWINLDNAGTAVPSGILQLTLDDDITFVSSAVVPDSISGQNIYWTFDSLQYFQSELIQVLVLMPDFTSMGDLKTSYLTAYVDSLGGTLPFKDSLQQVVVCAYDPNDKTATPAGIDSLGYIPITTTYLDYTIRFQNTGNDTSVNVVIKDQLDPNLNWQSFDPISSSHPVNITVDQFGKLVLTFQNIMLPDSNVNEPASHGFFKYRIGINSGTQAGTHIYNTAEIYFDYNPAVITNTKIHTLYDCTTMLEGASVNSIVCENDFMFGIAPNAPSNANLLWTVAGDSLYGTTLIWQADTSGSIDLNLVAATDFCYADSIFSFNLISEIVGPTTIQQICEGDSILIFGNYEYLPAFYQDTLNAFFSGCDSIIGVQLIVYPNELVLGITSNDTICMQAGMVDINTSPAGGILTGPGLIGNQFSPTSAGSGQHAISYSYMDSNGCTFEDSLLINVINCLGISEIENGSMVIRPNPFSEQTVLLFEGSIPDAYQVVIYQIDGACVFRSDFVSTNSFIINRDNLLSGTYFIAVIDEQGIPIYRRTIVAL